VYVASRTGIPPQRGTHGGIITVIISHRMRWAGHEARKGNMRNTHKMLGGKPEEKRYLVISARTWGIILECILGK
jgi:hypothetical protein